MRWTQASSLSTVTNHRYILFTDSTSLVFPYNYVSFRFFTENVSAGAPVWVKTKENAVDTSKLDKDSSLKDLKVSGGTMDKAFDKYRNCSVTLKLYTYIRYHIFTWHYYKRIPNGLLCTADGI